MAKQTYAGLQKQIAALEAQAAELRDEEKAGVIAKIKEAILAYGITPKELFGSGAAKQKKSKSKFGAAAKFSDAKGNEWVGRGPHPQWLRDALAAGKKLEDFAIGGTKLNGAAKPNGAAKAASKTGPKKARVTKTATSKKPAKKAATKKAASKPAKKTLPAKYKDGAGNSWTGRGSQPRWLRDAIAGGKKLEELRV